MVNVAVLLIFGFSLGGYAHTASSAPDKAAQDLRAIVGILGRPTPRFKRGLNLIKKLLGDNRLVVAFVKLTAIAEVAVIKRVRQEIRRLVALDGLAAFRFNSVLG
ncbi:MAG: hypothetical protein A3I07_02480 [Candidatus Doudnabacteria bacterium RIFCSPLOWO2_02_FULL_42_9]|nr:MAG: hypothetical protein A3K07_00225 [Candidatus Doudnabacteria bacterium RIFCSPHIGHO2_01_43_10]OGE99592.1 MAG: hypothetical protein A3I07_02480 [Candidatus Doudnabacteria bacterium RIFCSPLOWO2_02_FULL_42_9]